MAGGRVLVRPFQDKLYFEESIEISKLGTDQALAYSSIKFTLNGVQTRIGWSTPTGKQK